MTWRPSAIMASEQVHVIDPSPGFLVSLWILALAGLFVPSTVEHLRPDLSWAGDAARTHRQSLSQKAWIEPWQPINQDAFSSAWIPCPSLEDALRLDQTLDDGFLDRGRLVLAEGGLAWIPR